METPSEIDFHGKNSDKCDQEDAKGIRNASAASSSQSVLVLRVSDLDDTPMCRICYNGPSRERLLRPCKCKGTIEYVHRHCLERWLESTNYDTCELCNHHFTTKRTRKNFWEWCRQPETRRDRRNFVGDCTCFLFLTPLGIATFWLCTEGAVYYQRVKSSTLETVALIVLAIFLVLAYITWIALCTRYHLTIWSRWRNHNWSVRIVDRQPDSSNVSSDDEIAVINVPDPPPADHPIKQPLIVQPLPPYGDRRAPQEPPDESGQQRPAHFVYSGRVFNV